MIMLSFRASTASLSILMNSDYNHIRHFLLDLNQQTFNWNVVVFNYLSYMPCLLNCVKRAMCVQNKCTDFVITVCLDIVQALFPQAVTLAMQFFLSANIF